MRRAAHRSDRGVAAVEFALIAPILVLLILGIVEFGFRYAQANVVGNAAFIGARHLSIHHNPAGAKIAALAAAENPGGATVAITGGSCPEDPPAGSVIPNVTVTITARFDSPTGLDINLNGGKFMIVKKAVARCN